MADRSAPDMVSRASKSRSSNSARMSHSLCVPDENPMSIGPKISLSPVEESFSAIYPRAAYIAAPAASQIIANNIGISEERKRDKFLADTISIAPSALALVNRFLDQLLFDTLSNSQTLAMPSLRPAIVEVLKPNFAFSAIKRADLELKEYLDGSEDCILSDMQDAIDLVGNVDVYPLWKQTRLKCMLYSSLGEMDDENGILSNTSLVAVQSMMISPAVAIFMTSILEFMGEQILAVAGRAAHRRLRSKNANSLCGQDNITLSTGEHLIVEVLDVEYIAFDKLLGELWRTWKENEGLSAVYSSRPRKGSQASIRTLPSLRELQFGDEINPQLKNDLSSSILKRLAHLDLATTDQTSRNFSDPSNIKISQADNQIRSRICEDTFKDIFTPSRPKSCSLIDLAKNHLVPRARKRRANSMPGSARSRSRSPRTFKRLKPFSKTEDNHFQQADNTFSLNETIIDISNSTVIPKEDVLNRLAPNESDRTGRELSDLDQNSCILEESSIQVNSIDEKSLYIHKTTKNLSLNNFDQNRYKLNNEKLTSSRSSSVDLKGRSSQNSEKFKTPRKNAMVLPRRTSFQGKSSVRHSVIRRPMSMSIPRSIDNDQYFGIEHSIFPSPPLLRTSNSRSTSIGTFSEYQLDQVEDLKEGSDNDELPTKLISKLALNESEIEADKTASPEIANFAVAVQGVDIYNLDTDFVPCNIDEKKKNLQTTQSNLWYTKPYLNDYVRKRLSEHESDGNVSPISQLNDEPKYDGRISPVSTVSSMEKTLDQEIPSRSRHNYFTSTSETPDHHLNLSAPLTSNPVTTPPKYHTHSINSRSSSRSHKVKTVFNSDENALGKFDQLIKSDQTIQYTLTPETVRDVEVSDPIQRFNRKNSEQGSILVNKVSPSSSKFVTIDTSQTKPFSTKANSIRTPESNSKPSSVTEVRLRSGAPQPRDARIERDRSLSDFAKFIRTTGPDVSIQNNPSSFLKTSPVENQGHKSSYLERHSSSRSILHKRLNSSSTRLRFPGRQIISKRSDSLSGFIDFARPAPKLELSFTSTSQDQASYNSPTLSNRSWGISESKNGDGSLVDPRQWQNSPSINSSVTSQSALLVSSSQNRTSVIHSRTQFDDKSKMPTRKVRKVRDPYSIDFLDEEDWGESSLESKPKQSESLKDFLRNTSPTDIPEDNEAGKTTKANPSTPGLMSLFGRRPASPQHSSRGLLGSIVSHQPATNSSGSKKPTNPRPAQLSSIISRANVPRTNFSPKNFEPREATSRVRTDDLAKFLMHNDPPAALREKPSAIPFKNLKTNLQVSHKNEAGSFQRMFSRKRTSTLSKS
ncbi:hypothetical protein EPUL_004990 [Erysiphe pulchra]|uniref:Uncharacterized protein n=1 Tax=Erysiphe pulchra TaxID=225359 RepID=A0A2S4PP88_9PEZI|nr:hypothetical protein EPUL_004990 [Erysiphe pulchra]